MAKKCCGKWKKKGKYCSDCPLKKGDKKGIGTSIGKDKEKKKKKK